MADYRVVNLVTNHIYPTYQLYAQMADKQTDPKDGLRLAALVCTDWVKRRLSDSCPEELLSVPDPSEYKNISDDCLTSFHMSGGFVVDIISDEEHGEWSLQITEPDLGGQPGESTQTRTPVAGRSIQTDISFKIEGDDLCCGFRTQVSDPSGDIAPATVYRLAVIKELANHPDFGFRQILPLDGKKRDLTKEQIKNFLDLKNNPENQLPLVVFVEKSEQAVQAAPVIKAQPVKTADSFVPLKKTGTAIDLAGKKFDIGGPVQIPSFGNFNALPSDLEEKLQEAAKAADSGYFRFDAGAFAEKMIGICLVYDLEPAQLKKFRELSGIDCTEGDIVMLDPVGAGSGIRIIHVKKDAFEKTMDDFRTEMYQWPRGKDISYGPISFLSATRSALLESLEHAQEDAQEIAELDRQRYEQRMKEIREKAISELSEKDEIISQLKTQVERQKQYTAKVEDEKTELRRIQQEELEKKDAEIAKKVAEIEFLKRTLDRPDSMDGVADWVEKYFSSRMVLGSRAKDMLEDKALSSYNVDICCDGLEFLAEEYWEVYFNQIPFEDVNTQASKKYNRTFEITPIGEVTYNNGQLYNQYHIQYDGTEVALDWHLKAGRQNGLSLRIYFTFDKERKLIVVGSLPNHLETVTIQ